MIGGPNLISEDLVLSLFRLISETETGSVVICLKSTTCTCLKFDSLKKPNHNFKHCFVCAVCGSLKCVDLVSAEIILIMEVTNLLNHL